MERTQDNSRPALALNLFGPLLVQIHGEPLPKLRSRKGAWLLALLTLRQGKPVDRDWLVGTLWPDSKEGQALAYLRQTLTELRHALQTEVARLHSPTRQTLALDLSGADVDLLTFDVCIHRGDLDSLERATQVYRGPLLEGCTEEWVLPERSVREQSYLTALQRLADAAMGSGDARIAVGYLRRVVSVDPLQEGAQRALMEALASAGDFAAAVQVYRELRLLLHRELNAEPDPQTTAAYNRLRSRTREQLRATVEVSPSSPSSPAPRYLPRPLTELVGREADVFEVSSRLRQRRLVTLTGIGGVGKTRLSIAVGEAVVEEYADGAWFVELASLSDENLINQSIASVIGLREEPGRSPYETVLGYLRARQSLIILDNCEHLLEACAQWVGDILQGCPGVRVLATSRQALGITGEVVWQAPPLTVPDTAHLPTDPEDLLAAVSACTAVQLLVERAEAAQKMFALTSGNAVWVARICERLDGIPLAIELAAGGVKVLPVEQIAQRLDDVFRLLTAGSRTALPRQQTLRATLDWSYDLLTPEERTLLARLSAFTGGWTLEAAEFVCAEQGRDGREDPPLFPLPPGSVPLLATRTTPAASAARVAGAIHPSLFPNDVLPLLAALVDKSLVVVTQDDGVARYRMLETVRQYGAEKLRLTGEIASIRTRHCKFFLHLAEEAAPELRRPEQAGWLKRLETDHGNLRAALEWSVQSDPEPHRTTPDGTASSFLLPPSSFSPACLRLCSAMHLFWSTRGYYREGRLWCEKALAKHGTAERTRERADALETAGALAFLQDDYDVSETLHSESLAIQREIGNEQGIAVSLTGLGRIANVRSDSASAQSFHAESLDIYRKLSDRLGIAIALSNLALVMCAEGDYAAARAHCEQCLSIQREIGNRSGVGAALVNLGLFAFYQADYPAARVYTEESIEIHREIGNPLGTATGLNNLGLVAYYQSDMRAAQDCYEQSLAIYRKIGNPSGVADSLNNLGMVTYTDGDPNAARSYFEESLVIHRDIDERIGIAGSLYALASLCAAEANATGESSDLPIAALQRATRIWSAAHALRAEIGAVLSAADQASQEQEIAAARARLSEAQWNEAWAEGATMPQDQAIVYALQGRV